MVERNVVQLPASRSPWAEPGVHEATGMAAPSCSYIHPHIVLRSDHGVSCILYLQRGFLVATYLCDTSVRDVSLLMIHLTDQLHFNHLTSFIRFSVYCWIFQWIYCWIFQRISIDLLKDHIADPIIARTTGYSSGFTAGSSSGFRLIY